MNVGVIVLVLMIGGWSICVGVNVDVISEEMRGVLMVFKHAGRKNKSETNSKRNTKRLFTLILFNAKKFPLDIVSS